VNCKKMAVLLSAYIDGELSPVEKKQLESHIRGCTVCSAKYERLKLTDNLFTTNKSVSTSPFFETRLLERLPKDAPVANSILDLFIFPKELLFVFTTLLLVVSTVTFKSYFSDTANGYNELQEYFIASISDSAAADLLNKKYIEPDDIIKYIMNSESSKEIKK